MSFIHNSHSVGNNVHHFQWCTKYRYQMFRNDRNAEICKTAIQKIAQNHNIDIKEISVMPDHIHVIAQIPTTMAQSHAMQLLKGGSSHTIFREIPNFRKRYPRGTLWSRGNFKDSVGRLTEDAAEEYVRNQFVHHGVDAPKICGL